VPVAKETCTLTYAHKELRPLLTIVWL